MYNVHCPAAFLFKKTGKTCKIAPVRVKSIAASA